jgi:hypothetical protein
VFRELVADSIQFVNSEIRAGRSLAEVKAAGVPKKWKSWEKGVPQEMFVEAIYKELEAQDGGRAR